MFDALVKLYDDFASKERIQNLAQLARENQFDFKNRIEFGRQPTALKEFDAFDKKGTKRFIGVLDQPMEGAKGTVRFYDFLTTKDLETKSQSIVEIHCEDIFVDHFKIEPKSNFAKMKGFFVSDKLDFPDLKTFNSQFQISSSNENGATPLTRKALQLMEDFPGIRMEAEENYFLFYYLKKDIKLSDILPTIDFGEEFVRLLCFDREDDYV